MDTAYNNALKRKEEIERKIEALRADLAVVETFLDLHKRFEGANGESDESRAVARSKQESRIDSQADLSPETFSLDRRRGNPVIIAAMAGAILKDAGRPMTRGELADEIEKRGINLPGADKARRAKYVGTILWRKRDRFENLDEGYWLRGKARLK